jgi:aminoglycoside phosphotransferase (APT) family kinase protein
MSHPIEIVVPEGVTPRWVSEALGSRGIDAVVDRVAMESVGTGQLSEARRFHLTYRGTPPPEAPASVVGKFPCTDAVAVETGKNMKLYRAEVMFYRELAARARLRTPFPYVAEISDDEDFVLLFEDLAPSQVGDQMRGCTVEEARRAFKEMSMLHAAFWNDMELAAQPWLSIPKGAQGLYTTELIESSWAYYKKTYPGALSQEVVAVCEKYVRNHAYWNRPRPLPKCFSHNDFRPDNMMFPPDGGRIALVDWQTSSFLGAGMDPAYFLGAIFPREVRRKHEHELLVGYHEDLVAYGVRDYTFDHLMDDYRHYSFAQLAVAIAATVIVKRTERGDRLFIHMITGAAEQAADNHALDLLPD